MVSKLVHRDKSREYLAQAATELAAGDDMQATEKGWGAASQIVKAIAEKRGWEHGAHYQLHNVIFWLVQETGDDELRTLFSVANSLHVHFYEGWLTIPFIEESVKDVARFIDKVEALLDGGA